MPETPLNAPNGVWPCSFSELLDRLLTSRRSGRPRRAKVHAGYIARRGRRRCDRRGRHSAV